MKKANFADRYLEKIVLAAAVLLAAAGVYFFVVATPNRTEVNRKDMLPGEVPDLLSTKAQELRTALDREHPLPDFPLPEFAEIIAQRDADRPSPRLAFEPVDRPGLNVVGSIDNLEPYDLPNPPIARGAIARQGTAVLELTGEAGVDQPLLRLLNAEDEPYDFRYVTVGAIFDLAEWRRRLESGDPQVRPNWWQNSLEDVTGVFLERQELLDPATGEWSAPVRLDPLRSLDALEPDYDVEGNTDDAIEAALTAVRNEQPAYRRPPFVRVAQPYLLEDPFVEKRSDQEERDLEALFKDLDSKNRLIENLRRTIDRGATGDRLNSLRDREAKLSAEQADIAIQINELVGRSLLGETAIEQRDPLEYEPEPDFDIPDIPDARRQRGLERFNRDIPAIPRQANRRSQPARPARPDRRADPDDVIVEAVEENPDEIRVWAHDLTVEPGRTYRYRVVVTVRNPLFRKTSVPAAQKEENFFRLTLGPSAEELAATADPGNDASTGVWSNPVTIEPELYYFLVGSQARTARVEVWRVYDGRWRDALFQVTPGDPIGGTAEIEIDGQAVPLAMQADDIAVDVVSTAAGALGGGNSELIVVSGTTGQLGSRSTSSGRALIDRIRLLNQNRINELLEETLGEDRVAASNARR
ncbi:MAG: hypothetical protein AAGI54_07360 [Planctomycetota bacterium]